MTTLDAGNRGRLHAFTKMLNSYQNTKTFFYAVESGKEIPQEKQMKFLTILLFILSLTGCQSQTTEEQVVAPKVEVPKQAKTPTQAEEQEPPTPPLFENFQATPQISLFPRAGAFHPEAEDEKGIQFWRTYIDHLTRTSGPTQIGTEAEPNIAFGFRAIKGLDSVGVFSPIAVSPETTYEVKALLSCNLTEGATAGIGVLEFKKFLWIGEQFSETMAKEHQVGTQQGIKLKGNVEKQSQSFTFTTGPRTKMIHLVFFRDGVQDRNPVLIDDIEINEIALNKNIRNK